MLLPCLGPLALWLAVAAPAQTVRVENGQPEEAFSYQQELRETTEGYRIERLTYPSPTHTAFPENNTVPADLYLPPIPQGQRRPAVICLHILHGDFQLERLTCAALANRGLVAMLPKLPYYGERSPSGGRSLLLSRPALFLEAIPQGLTDLRRAVDLLCSRADVDPDRIGVVGISLGGIVGATFAGREPRIHRMALLLAGGDLKTIIDHAAETRALSRAISGLPDQQKEAARRVLSEVDPLSTAAGLRTRAAQGRVLLINAAEDEVIPRGCTEKLAAALGLQGKVRWLDGLGHYSAIAALPQTLRDVVSFFAEDLPSQGVQIAQNSPSEALSRLAAVLADGVRILSGEPKAGRRYSLALQINASFKGNSIRNARISWDLGPQRQFRLAVIVPGLADVALGQSDRLWLATGSRVYWARKSNGQPVDLLERLESKHRLKLQLFSGLLTHLNSYAGVLEPLVKLELANQDSGPTVIATTKDAKRATVRLTLDSTGRVPRRLELKQSEGTGEVIVNRWEVDSKYDPASFQPPPGAEHHEVDAEDLTRMFSAVIHLALEKLE